MWGRGHLPETTGLLSGRPGQGDLGAVGVAHVNKTVTNSPRPSTAQGWGLWVGEVVVSPEGDPSPGRSGEPKVL